MNKIFSIPVSHIDIQETNKNDLIGITLYAISNQTNRNNSEFLEDSFIPSIPTIYNKPILAYFNPRINDTEEHNSDIGLDDNNNLFYDYQYDGAEKPVGLIPESASITIENIKDKKWIVIKNAFLWSEYNHQLLQLIQLQKHKKISVEVEVLDSYMDNGVERIKLWKFLGVTILGKTPDGKHLIEEGIEGAHLQLEEVQKSLVFQKYKKQLSFALKDANKNDILLKYGIKENTDDTKVNINKVICKKPTKEENMKSFIENANKAGYAYLGLVNGKLKFARIVEVEDDTDCKDCEKCSIYEVDKKDCADDKEFAEDKLTEATDDTSDKEQLAKDLEAEKADKAKMSKDLEAEKADKEKLSKDLETEKAEKEKMSKDLEAEKDEKKQISDKFEKCEKELKDFVDAKFKSETDFVLENDKEFIDEDTKAELIKMRDEGKFSTSEDFIKELAFRQYSKRTNKSQNSHLAYSITQTQKEPQKPKNQDEALIEALSKI